EGARHIARGLGPAGNLPEIVDGLACGARAPTNASKVAKISNRAVIPQESPLRRLIGSARHLPRRIHRSRKKTHAFQFADIRDAINLLGGCPNWAERHD